MDAAPARLPDWEAFYRDYRKPGYVAGFEITTKLGGGAFGIVFRAKRLSIGKDYAIKFLQVDDVEVRKAILAELEAVKLFAQIDHPNLVSIEDRGEVDGIPFLVMAFAGTETLRDRLPQGRPPSAEEKDELLRCFLQASRGLQALHERSLVHFDIKPANVFLKGSVARLGDYGLSKLVTHSRGSLSMGRGTPYYMAPELLQRRGDHRSDIYSLGVLLYELLCGVVPFRGDSEWEVLKAHETKAPELPEYLTARERMVLQRCLAKDPAARFQSVQDVIATLGAPSSVAAAVPAAPPPVPRASAAWPECVVPPLPGTSTRTRATAAPRAGRSKAIGVLGVLLLFGAGALLVATTLRTTRVSYSMAQAHAVDAAPPMVDLSPSPRGPRRTAASSENTVDKRFEQLVAATLRTARTAEQRERRPELVELDADRFAVPPDFAAYGELVRGLAKAPMFSPVQAQRIEQFGRPAFVAAVAFLQDLDYEDADDCRRASHVQRLLGQMLGNDALVLQPVPGEPCEGETCRFQAIASGWRQLAEQFARSEASFTQLRTARGKVAGVDR